MARVEYEMGDPDGTPTVRCLEDDGACDVRDGRILISGLEPGTHFFTVQAQDEGGKRSFDHFVIDVKR